MRGFFQFLLMALLLFVMVDARGYSGGRSSGRSSSFSRSSRSKPKTYSRPAKRASKPSRAVTKPSAIKKSSKTTAAKPKAVSANKLDKQRQKQMVSKDKAAFKKYSNKKQAKSAYQKKMASSNKYTNATPPASRPKNIPQNVNAGGRSVNVTYNVLPGGGYGYGYMDPMSGMFMAVAAHHMIVNASMMRSAGYGQWDASGRPVVVRSASNSVAFIVLLFLVGAIVVAVIVSNHSKNSKY